MVVTISHSGYIKRTSVSTYKKQRRGGRGLNGQALKDEDFIEHLFVASTHDYLLVFTDDGRCFWLKVHEIPQAGRAAKGKPIVNLINVTPGHARSRRSCRCASSATTSSCCSPPRRAR